MTREGGEVALTAGGVRGGDLVLARLGRVLARRAGAEWGRPRLEGALGLGRVVLVRRGGLGAFGVRAALPPHTHERQERKARQVQPRAGVHCQ